jgi:hypothetical protein
MSSEHLDQEAIRIAAVRHVATPIAAAAITANRLHGFLLGDN